MIANTNTTTVAYGLRLSDKVFQERMGNNLQNRKKLRETTAINDFFR